MMMTMKKKTNQVNGESEITGTGDKLAFCHLVLLVVFQSIIISVLFPLPLFISKKKKKKRPTRTIFGAQPGGAVQWQVDTEIRFDGNFSMHCRVRHPCNVSARLLSAPVPVEAGRTYQVSAFSLLQEPYSGDMPWIWVVQLDGTGAEIKHLPVGIELQASTDWVQGTATFQADAQAAAAVVYIGAMNVANASFWIDSLMLLALDYGLLNVIRTTATDVRLQGFAVGHDYSIVAAASNVSIQPSFRLQNHTYALDRTLQTTLTAHPKGRLRPGMAVTVDYDFQPGAEI